MSGRAIEQRSAIWPKPRMASSRMQTSVSGSSRQSVSGTPISLLKLASAATVRAADAHNAARMSFVDVLPLEPVLPTTRPVGEQRRRGAAHERLVAELGPPADRDEQVAGLDAARVDLDAGDLLGVRV